MNDTKNIPIHISIIPDGNRRWAKARGFMASYGHVKSGDYKHIRSLVSEAKEQGTKYLSLWALSTENWSRPKGEREVIFKLVMNTIDNIRKDISKNKIKFKFRFVGRKDRLPKNLVSEISKLEKETKNFKDFTVILCLDYGGRDEILRAINKMIKSGIKNVNEVKFSNFLDTSNIPDVDLIIRTAGEQRTSGFMPFQSVYSELYFTKTSFPDFQRKDLRKAIEDFAKRKRNFGR